ncbi:MAG: flagellar assembly protein FliX [Alphaproteobacteria bacterium]
MDIQKTRIPSSVSIKKIRKNKQRQDGDFSKTNCDSSSPIHSEDMVSQVDALFLSLEQDNIDEEKIIEHANNLLDYLETLRIDLLQGITTDISVIDKLCEDLNKHDVKFINPELQQIVKEIQTRALVELAKMKKKFKEILSV